LGDIGWIDHPDYRAIQALDRVLRLSALAAEHSERAFLALTTYHRYGGQPGAAAAAGPARAMLEDGQETSARTLGLALRLGYAIAGGAPGILPDMPIALDNGKMVLIVPPSREALVSGDVERRLQSLAGALDRKGHVVTRGDRKAAGF
jgi:exopolyphosphatase/guanosine-5'-triphosphate,3'-diphosphate pyrophosphatase